MPSITRPDGAVAIKFGSEAKHCHALRKKIARTVITWAFYEGEIFESEAVFAEVRPHLRILPCGTKIEGWVFMATCT